jgi:hypothetical protein
MVVDFAQKAIGRQRYVGDRLDALASVRFGRVS